MDKESKTIFVNKYLINRENKYDNHIFHESYFKKNFPDVYNEIMSIEFPDDFKFTQKLWHYVYDDFDFDKRCKCSLHGKLKFIDFNRGYREFCAVHCEEYDRISSLRRSETRIKNCGSLEESYKIGFKKMKQTCLERYGVENGGGTQESLKKINDSKIQHYGTLENLYKCNKEKSNHSRIAKYGSVKESYIQSVNKRMDTLSNVSDDYYDSISQKRKLTNLKIYGDEKYNNIKKCKETCIERYGVDNYSKTEMFKSANTLRQNNRTLSKYDEIIDITGETYHCKCIDCSCKMCDDKEFFIDMHTFFNRRFYNIDLCTKRTPVIPNPAVSSEEKSLCQYIRSIYSGEIIENDRSVLSGRELDIYLPELKTAFEFNGIYWHNEFNKPRRYHQEKSLECMEKGIRLIHVWEDDWNFRNGVVKDFIRSVLGLTEHSIGARKCDVREVPGKDAMEFLDRYHIQGGVRNGKSIGLYYGDELVEILTFGQLRKNMGGNPEDGYYEIYRVCTKAGYSVQGGFGRLLKHFEDSRHPVKVITYGNLDYTYGNVYLKCGFVKDGLSEPTYAWVVDGMRRHRSNYMKSKLKECRDNPELTENEVMYSRGYWRCWDAGKIRFVKTY